MYINNKILVGKNEDKELSILLNKANRHGLITGATGTGKTITLKVMAESFANAGTSVFMVDVKGDLAGTAFMGQENENVSSRVQKLGLDAFKYDKFPCVFLDVYGKNGHPVRTTVEKIGHRILSKMLGLSEVQDSVLSILYAIARDEEKELVDLNDLNAMIILVENKRNEYTLKYGNISPQTLSTIKRNVLDFIEDGGNEFFGKPYFDVKKLRGVNPDNGYGQINILDAQELFKKPTLYVSMIIWLLNSLNENFDEVGDLDKPRLVFFFDEAHLIFEEMPKSITDYVIQTIKLIRSKGIGIYFISQLPTDLPGEVLSQLGNRVQHALRAYTPAEQAGIKAAADSFRTNPNFNTAQTILSLGTGEALVSFIDENGEPTMVEKVTILPPQSRMGTITDEERKQVIANSPISGIYEQKEEVFSAAKKIELEIQQSQEEKQAELDRIAEEKRLKEEEKELEKQQKAEEKARKEEERAALQKKREEEKAAKEAEKARKNSIGYKLGKKVTNKATDKIINKGLNSLFKNLFK